MINRKCVFFLASTDGYAQEACLTAEMLVRFNLIQDMKCFALFGVKKPKLPKKFNIINITKSGTWSSDLLDGLRKIKEEYLLLWLDDLIPLKILNVKEIHENINWLIHNNGDYLRLNPLPPASGKKIFNNLAQILPGEIYRTSTVLSVWKRSTLIDLLLRGESAWDFEINGSLRSDKYLNFYACNKTNIIYANLVVKGLINPKVENIINNHGVNTKALKRRRMNNFECFLLYFYNFRSYLFKFIPAHYQRGIKRYLSKINLSIK